MQSMTLDLTLNSQTLSYLSHDLGLKPHLIWPQSFVLNLWLQFSSRSRLQGWPRPNIQFRVSFRPQTVILPHLAPHPFLYPTLVLYPQHPSVPGPASNDGPALISKGSNPRAKVLSPAVAPPTQRHTPVSTVAPPPKRPGS